MKTVSLGQRLQDFGGFGPGFHLLRLVLASGVVVWHSFPLTAGNADIIDGTYLWLLIAAMVPMFFALSGFLVAASASRLSATNFAINRAARIVPGLTLVVLASAFVAGPLMTTVPLTAYFSSVETYTYLLNIVGPTHYSLPGVFGANPIDAVNGSLWTVKHEYVCYVVMAGLILLRLTGARMIGTILASLVAIAIASDIGIIAVIGQSVGVSGDIVVQASKIMPYFFLGALIYVVRDRIAVSNGLAAASLIAIAAASIVLDPSSRHMASVWIVMCIPFTYLVIWCGMQSGWSVGSAVRGDYSYGIYLFHFPVMQVMVDLFDTSVWWVALLLSAPVIALLSALSWHVVEQPALRWRKSFAVTHRGN